MSKDCGPAFPGQTNFNQGMSLRDYFAAKALQGALADSSMQQEDYSELAGWAYKVADAMLAERDK